MQNLKHCVNANWLFNNGLLFLMKNTVEEARINLAAAYRLADMHGLSEGICNHLTLVVPGYSDRFLIIAYGTQWSQARASDLLIVDISGNIIEGKGVVEDTALYIHGRIHALRPDLSCIMHTHQSYTLAIAMTEKGRLLPASQNAMRFQGRIAYDDDYNGLALAEIEGDRIVAAMENKNILFMANHGVLVGGVSVASTYDDLYYLERAATTQVLAESRNKTLKLIPEDLATMPSQQILSNNNYALDHFKALKKILDKTQPDYKE